MGGVQVNRWKRYGKDRLYVNDETGTSLGWMDRQTGAVHVTDPARIQEVNAALAPHRPTLRWPEGASMPTAGPAALAPNPSALAKPAIPMPAGDLAANRPGELAFRQAAAERARAPIRSFLGRVFGVHTDERAWRIGAQGEEKVAARLAGLERHGWRVLHSVPVGAGEADIDHVVIGPGGVFTINAKHHPGNSVWVGGEVAMVNGQRLPYVRNSRHEAQRAARLLAAASGEVVPVVGLIAVVGARLTVRRQPGLGVVVLERRKLGRWLRRLPRTMNDEQVLRLYHIARQPRTWRP